MHNTHVIIDDGGNIVANYRKVHLFDVDVPNGPVLMESRNTAPGDKVGGDINHSMLTNSPRLVRLARQSRWLHSRQV